MSEKDDESFFGGGSSLNITESLTRLMDVLLDFFVDKDIEQKTTIDRNELILLTKIKYKDDIIKKVFKVDLGYQKNVCLPYMRKANSINGRGRQMAENVLAIQLENILMRPRNAINRLMGNS